MSLLFLKIFVLECRILYYNYKKGGSVDENNNKEFWGNRHNRREYN